jgi:hypothetical protein
MSKEYSQERRTKLESLSDEEIKLALQYLEPELKRDACGILAFVVVLAIFLFLCAILVSLRFGGL